MTNQQLKAHCEDVIANPQDHLDWVVDMAKEALAALTQPATPALRLPDAKETQYVYHGGSGAFQAGKESGFNECLAEVKRLNAPHTAPIDPICATGGAEWTDKQCLEFLSIAFRHANISGDVQMDDIRLGIKMLNAAAQEGK